MVSNIRLIKNVLFICIDNINLDMTYSALSVFEIAEKAKISIEFATELLIILSKENLVYFDNNSKKVLGYTLKGLLSALAFSDKYTYLKASTNANKIDDCVKQILQNTDFYTIYTKL